MAVEPSATFQYVTVVPEGGAKASPWAMEPHELFREPPIHQLVDTRLVGWKPLLYISDAGITPNPTSSRPAVCRTELRLVATDKKHASQETASYFFDRDLFNSLRTGDVFHMVRTECCGFGASAIRQGRLIFAVGEVTAVPLGSIIKARIPTDLIQDAEEVFRKRDPEFGFPELPIEFRSGDESCILYRGEVRMAGYHVRVENGFYPNEGSIPECVSISLDETCDWVAASATAQLLKMA
jgi:hypothetical protein